MKQTVRVPDVLLTAMIIVLGLLAAGAVMLLGVGLASSRLQASRDQTFGGRRRPAGRPPMMPTVTGRPGGFDPVLREPATIPGPQRRSRASQLTTVPARVGGSPGRGTVPGRTGSSIAAPAPPRAGHSLVPTARTTLPLRRPGGPVGRAVTPADRSRTGAAGSGQAGSVSVEWRSPGAPTSAAPRPTPRGPARAPAELSSGPIDRRPERERVRPEQLAHDAAAYAAQTLARAEQAEATTNQARIAVAELQQVEHAAWEAYESAYERATYARNRAAEEQQAATVAATQNAPDDEARDLVSQAAYAAHRRGDLSTVELQAILQRVEGHDPLIDVLHRDALRRSATANRARQAYERAAAAARAAAEQVHVAEVAEVACVQEAVQAAIEAQQAIAAVPPRGGPGRLAIGPGGGTSR